MHPEGKPNYKRIDAEKNGFDYPDSDHDFASRAHADPGGIAIAWQRDLAGPLRSSTACEPPGADQWSPQ
jgi:hypothetical protein